PVSRGGECLGVDQCWMLPGIELTFVRNPTGVNRVRQQPIDVSARERFAAALGAVRCRAALRPEPQAIGLFLDPAHAAELAIKGEDAAHGLRLGRVDDKRAFARVIAERYVAAREPAVVVVGSGQYPTLVTLAADVGLA